MKRFLIWTMLFALLLTGCTVAPGTIGTRPTVEDLFHPPIQTVPTTDGADTTNPKPTEPTATEPVRGGGMGWEILGLDPNDGLNISTYTGGEMNIPLHVDGSGIITAYGIGILLMFDGRPQPYRTSENDEYKYMHSFTKDIYPVDKSGNINIDTILSFTPLSGQKGDLIPCDLISIVDPNFSPAEWGILGTTGHKLTSAYMNLKTNIRFEADPPEAERLQVEDRLKSVEITTIETTSEEISGWTSDDMLKFNRHKIYVNDRDLARGGSTWDVTEDTEIVIRFEVWGSPYVHYELLIFMDNQPISVAEEDIIRVHVDSGKKTIVTAKLDMSGFDGESHIYCILVPRNKLDLIGQGIRAGLIVTKYTFLFDDSNPKG